MHDPVRKRKFAAIGLPITILSDPQKAYERGHTQAPLLIERALCAHARQAVWDEALEPCHAAVSGPITSTADRHCMALYFQRRFSGQAQGCVSHDPVEARAKGVDVHKFILGQPRPPYSSAAAKKRATLAMMAYIERRYAATPPLPTPSNIVAARPIWRGTLDPTQNNWTVDIRVRMSTGDLHASAHVRDDGSVCLRTGHTTRSAPSADTACDFDTRVGQR